MRILFYGSYYKVCSRDDCYTTYCQENFYLYRYYTVRRFNGMWLVSDRGTVSIIFHTPKHFSRSQCFINLTVNIKIG